MQSIQPDQASLQGHPRYLSLDVLRGFAVLAIFAVNIKGMAAPFPFYFNPTLWNSQTDMVVASLQAFLIDDKWRTIFTGLFGAGLVVFMENAARKNKDAHKLINRRLRWLLVFGLIHLLLIWVGDILTSYALIGFLAVRFRAFSSRVLWRWAITLFVIATVWMACFDWLMVADPQARNEMEYALWTVSGETIASLESVYLAGPVAHFWDRLGGAFGFFIFYFLLGGRFIETLAVMVAGMALWKTGFFQGGLVISAYRKIFLWGAGLALLTDALRWIGMALSDWAFTAYMELSLLNIINGPAGAMAYSALIILAVMACTDGAGRILTLFANAGRMAFTNYIACSLIGTTIFYGHGLGLFGQLSLGQLMGIVVAVWAALLAASTAWLKIAHHGPLEWLWRSVTYGEPKPLFRRDL